MNIVLFGKYVYVLLENFDSNLECLEYTKYFIEM